MISAATTCSEWRRWLALLACIGICFAVAGIGGLATSHSVGTWYPSLHKPAWTPPSWVFSPVWTVLYLSMAVAVWLVWQRRDDSSASMAMVIFTIQLALNLAWSIVFFWLRSPLAGLVDIVLLWLAILATAALFWRVSTLAGWIMVPYLAWVTYALTLNAGIWRLNP